MRKFKIGLTLDGGAVQLIPVKVLKYSDCDFSIGVDGSAGLFAISGDKLKSAFDIAHRTSEIAVSVLRQIQIKDVDFLVNPEVQNIKWFEIKNKNIFQPCVCY